MTRKLTWHQLVVQELKFVCVMERYRSEFVQVVSTQMSDQALLKMGGVWKGCNTDEPL